MSSIVSALKQSVRLGSITFVLAVLGCGLLVLAVRRRRWAVAYLSSAVIGLWLLATPLVAERFAATLDTGEPPLLRAEDARGADTIVVLGAGGSTYRAGGLVAKQPSPAGVFRVLEAARLYRLLGNPTVIVSGGVTDDMQGAAPESEALRDVALSLGIPADRIQLESRSLNTRDEAVEIQRMFAGREHQPFVLVTSPTHMGRALAVFRAVGLNPVASRAAWKSDGTDTRGWGPNETALHASGDAIYEWAAWGYYRRRGWLTTAGPRPAAPAPAGLEAVR
jgi:uncharacterized SAM-binding protein YcdF (DUF218 family)